MNTHNIYFHGEISKIPKLIMKKKKSSGAVFITCSQSLNTCHAMGRFSRRHSDIFSRKKGLTVMQITNVSPT